MMCSGIAGILRKGRARWRRQRAQDRPCSWVGWRSLRCITQPGERGLARCSLHFDPESPRTVYANGNREGPL